MSQRPDISRILPWTVLLVLQLWAATCAAERSDRNSIHAGATSVQFLTFGGGSPSGVYLKTHFSDRGALRLGASLSLNESNSRDPSSPLPHVESSRDYTITVSSEIDEYLSIRGPVTAFVGLGPYWFRGRSSQVVSDVFFASDSTVHSSYYDSQRKVWGGGARATVGFEWFFRRKLSAIGRVDASAGFGKIHDRIVYLTDNLPDPYLNNRLDSNTASAGTSSAALGLAVYF